ncbi:MAG: nucleotidyltransferase domain-containing protein [Candidatus Pacearchaeota archaeon]|nr:nucleotidyltransferase domain-containing protein [Candidatus Pacearchaeota archaeon]
MEPKENLQDELKNISLDYNSKSSTMGMNNQAKEEMEKTKKELEDFKKAVLKKYNFTMAIGIMPPQASEKIEEEEQVPEEEAKKKPMHVLVLIPEDNFKDLVKIKNDLIADAKILKQKSWIHVKTPVDIWNYCLDGKYDICEAIAMSFPIFDKGFLAALRVSQIHKSLVLKKFERYVQSYVVCGSFVRGDTTKASDVDVFVVIDDTDVKRMARLELKEKLRSIILQYIVEASELAGVKNKLNVQIYILTEFWESVKDAHPVIFTMIRDGIPLYDKGTFMPWKLLLKMGKLKPSPEAIDMFMASGDKMSSNVKRMLTDLLVIDIYWGVITPAQALLMLNGLPPPTTKETPNVFRETFVVKEKLLEKKYADILEKIVRTYKDFEHEKIKEIPGKDIDVFLKDAEEFLKRLKELRKQIEKKSLEKTIQEVYKNVFNMMASIFKKKGEKELMAAFRTEFVNKGKMPESYLKSLEELVKAKKDFAKGKMEKHAVENVRKNASLLINSLIEYSQRCELVELQRSRIILKARKQDYELVLGEGKAFLINQGKVSKINLSEEKLENSSIEELTNALQEQKARKGVKMDSKIFTFLRKILGDFEIIL